MNLADIRKKAAESRSSASAVSVVAVDASALLPELDISEPFACEDDYLTQLEMPVEEFPEEFFTAVGQVMTADTCEQELKVPPVETIDLCSETLPNSVDVTEILDTVPHKSAQKLTVAKRAVEYNPLETILSGRESAVDVEDDALFQSVSNSLEDVQEYLCFRVADEVYAISIMAIKEIVKPREATEVPRMPVFISGVLSLRGVIIPVMDMRIRLSLPVNPATGRERIVVLKRDSGFCGVLVDEVIQVARVRRSDIEDPPAVLEGIDREFVTGLGHFDKKMLILLNLDTILNIGVH